MIKYFGCLHICFLFMLLFFLNPTTFSMKSKDPKEHIPTYKELDRLSDFLAYIKMLEDVKKMPYYTHFGSFSRNHQDGRTFSIAFHRKQKPSETIKVQKGVIDGFSFYGGNESEKTISNNLWNFIINYENLKSLKLRDILVPNDVLVMCLKNHPKLEILSLDTWDRTGVIYLHHGDELTCCAYYRPNLTEKNILNPELLEALLLLPNLKAFSLGHKELKFKLPKQWLEDFFIPLKSNLLELELDNLSNDVSDFQILAYLQELRSLRLKKCNLDGWTIQFFIPYMKHLEKLQLIECEGLSVKDIASVVWGVPLRELRIQAVEQMPAKVKIFKPEYLEMLTKNLSGTLRNLSIRGYSLWWLKALKNLKKLECLDLDLIITTKPQETVGVILHTLGQLKNLKRLKLRLRHTYPIIPTERIEALLKSLKSLYSIELYESNMGRAGKKFLIDWANYNGYVLEKYENYAVFCYNDIAYTETPPELLYSKHLGRNYNEGERILEQLKKRFGNSCEPSAPKFEIDLPSNTKDPSAPSAPSPTSDANVQLYPEPFV